MKKSFLWSSCFVALAALVSCQKSQLIVNQIEGTYVIEKVVYNTANGDSVVSKPNSTMFFDDCNLKKQTGAQQCDGYIQIGGEAPINFAYRPEKSGSKISMWLNISNPDELRRFGGTYISEEQTDHSLILARYKNDQYLDKEIEFRLFLKE
jgi:hypothetical protein